MTFEVFSFLLFAISIITGLTVEGLKKLLGDKYPSSSNMVAGIVAVVLGICVGVFYCIFVSVAITAQLVVILIALVFLSWLCAMLGYDKVIQTISQIRK